MVADFGEDMTPAQREAALRLASSALHELERYEYATATNELREAVALLRELLAEPQGEPVAWHVCSVNSDGSLSLEFAAPWEELAHEHINDAINEHDIDGATSWVVRPVYASPQPQQTEPSQNAHPPQQRKPLTKVQITELAEQCGYDGAVPTVRLAFQGFKLDDFARAVERAHGIVEAP